MAEFNVLVAAGECKRICLDTLPEPISGIQSGVVENSSGEAIGRITSNSCLLLETPDTYTVVTSDNCGVLGIVEEVVPCPPTDSSDNVSPNSVVLPAVCALVDGSPAYVNPVVSFFPDSGAALPTLYYDAMGNQISGTITVADECDCDCVDCP